MEIHIDVKTFSIVPRTEKRLQGRKMLLHTSKPYDPFKKTLWTKRAILKQILPEELQEFLNPAASALQKIRYYGVQCQWLAVNHLLYQDIQELKSGFLLVKAELYLLG